MKFFLSTIAVLAAVSGTADAKIRRGRGRRGLTNDGDVIEIMSQNEDIKVYEDERGNEVIEIQTVHAQQGKGKGTSGDDGDREDECPASSGCEFEPSNPVKCGSGYECVYDNQCLAFSAGYGTEDCCSAPNPGGCPMIYEPILCGSKCPYDNYCISDLAGYSDSQCTGIDPGCDNYEFIIECDSRSESGDRVDVYLRDPSRSLDLEVITYSAGICTNKDNTEIIYYNSCYDVSELDLLTFGTVSAGVLVTDVTLNRNGAEIDSWSTGSSQSWCLSDDIDDHSGLVVGGDNWGDHCVDQIYFTPTGVRTGNFLPR